MDTRPFSEVPEEETDAAIRDIMERLNFTVEDVITGSFFFNGTRFVPLYPPFPSETSTSPSHSWIPEYDYPSNPEALASENTVPDSLQSLIYGRSIFNHATLPPPSGPQLPNSGNRDIDRRRREIGSEGVMASNKKSTSHSRRNRKVAARRVSNKAVAVQNEVEEGNEMEIDEENYDQEDNQYQADDEPEENFHDEDDEQEEDIQDEDDQQKEEEPQPPKKGLVLVFRVTMDGTKMTGATITSITASTTTFFPTAATPASAPAPVAPAVPTTSLPAVLPPAVQANAAPIAANPAAAPTRQHRTGVVNATRETGIYRGNSAAALAMLAPPVPAPVVYPANATILLPLPSPAVINFVSVAPGTLGVHMSVPSIGRHLPHYFNNYATTPISSDASGISKQSYGGDRGLPPIHPTTGQRISPLVWHHAFNAADCKWRKYERAPYSLHKLDTSLLRKMARANGLTRWIAICSLIDEGVLPAHYWDDPATF